MGTPKGPWQGRDSKLQQKGEPNFKTMRPPVRAPRRDARDTLSQKRGLRASKRLAGRVTGAQRLSGVTTFCAAICYTGACICQST